MNKTLAVKLGFSLLSGTTVGLIFAEWGIFYLLADEPIIYLACGAVFACGVLLPYFKTGKWAWERLMAVIAVSSLSLYTAVLLSISPIVANDLGLASFVQASLAGAAIVIVPFALLTRAKVARTVFGYGLIAALLGGLLARFTLVSDVLLLVILGHAGWHALISSALHFGVVDAVARDDATAGAQTMASVWKSRGVLS